MKIIVDADACPVKDIIEETARLMAIELVLVSNINHVIRSDYGQVVVVDGQSQSADIAIMNLTKRGDIVVTQDYGLASMALARGSYALDPQGRQYTENNIETLLTQRYLNQKARQAGQRIGGPRKRNNNDNQLFKERLLKLLQGDLEN